MKNPDVHLDQVALKQLTWKPSIIRNMAVEIVEKIKVPPFKLWPDQLSLDHVSTDDSNAVGTVWRMLAKADIISKTGRFRRSAASGRRASTVFEYELKPVGGRSRAITFLRRNGRIPTVSEVQTEFFAPVNFPSN